MVPATSGSELAKRLRLVVNSVPGPRGTSVKVVEKPGQPIMAGISSNNPFKQPECRRPNCPLVASEEDCLGRCAEEGITYKARCTLCEEEQKEEPEVIHSQYVGESSRTLLVRSSQHYRDYKYCIRRKLQGLERLEQDDSKSSFMFDHMDDKHPDSNMDPDKDFKFTIIDTFRDPLSRQVSEAVRIKAAVEKGIFIDFRNKKHIVNSLNRRLEHFAPIERREKNV